jgi:hypothetical protein
MLPLSLIVHLTLMMAASSAHATKPLPSREDMMRAMAAIQASHIDANVPPEASFGTFLQRDVRAHLVAGGQPSGTLEIELLRKGPTQSGVSYPKYYLWIRAAGDTGQRVEGAMLVAAVDRVRFNILKFTPAASVRSDPSSLAAIYPALLIPDILKRAGVK